MGQSAHERSVSEVELKKKLNNQILTFMAMARTVASATSRTAATATYRITAAATAVAMAMAREPQGAAAALARREEHVQGLGEKS